MADARLGEVFARVEARLARLERDYDKFTSSRGQEKLDAFEDVLIHGRALTNVMQTCRHLLPTFENWYAEKVELLKSDAGLQRFYRMRSELLKEGRLTVEQAAVIFYFEPWFPPPPDGAIGFMLWEKESGKSAWVVRRPDGTEEKVFYDLPVDSKVDEFLTFSPSLDVEDVRVDQTVHRYIAFLRRMVDELRALVIGSS